MIKKILIGLLILLAVFVTLVLMQPTEFTITRSATIEAPINKVFEQVNNLQNYNTWSPWANLDPNAKTAFLGPKEGKDAAFEWDGNNDVGKGKMTIAESLVNEKVTFDLVFEKPFAAKSLAIFTFKEVEQKTTVNWTMKGNNDFIGKAMSLCFDCDKMVGGQFEKGFDNMKNVLSKNK